MGLFVPRRHLADADSFPTDPAAVAAWLTPLRPIHSSDDAIELVRGLKHSNRLQNPLQQRRDILNLLFPALREVEAELMEICQAQTLPLTREFRRSAKLLDALLREQCHALKILLADSTDPSRDDIRRAMLALARRVEFLVLAYRWVSVEILQEANAIYRLSEQRETDASVDSGSVTTASLFAYIHLICLIDTRAVGIRQLPLLLAFLKNESTGITVAANAGEPAQPPAEAACTHGPSGTSQLIQLAVDLRHGAPAAAVGSLLIDDSANLRHMNTTSLRHSIESAMTQAPEFTAFLRGSDLLERGTLRLLRRDLTGQYQRSMPRRTAHRTMTLNFGFRAISASLMFASQLRDTTADDARAGSPWHMLNDSRLGACLWSDACRDGEVQVGELVALSAATSPEAESAASSPILARVCHLRAEVDGHLTIGVEYLASSGHAVTLNGMEDEASAADSGIVLESTDAAQPDSVLVPAFRHFSGDCVACADNQPDRPLSFGECLWANGLFSRFSITWKTSADELM